MAMPSEHPRVDLLRQAPGYRQATAIVLELRQCHGAPWLCYGVEAGCWLFGLRDTDTGKDVRIFAVEAGRLAVADVHGAIQLARDLIIEMDAKIADHALRQAAADGDPIRREAVAERETEANAWLRAEARRRWGDCAEAEAVRIDYGGRRG